MARLAADTWASLMSSESVDELSALDLEKSRAIALRLTGIVVAKTEARPRIPRNLRTRTASVNVMATLFHVSSSCLSSEDCPN